MASACISGTKLGHLRAEQNTPRAARSESAAYVRYMLQVDAVAPFDPEWTRELDIDVEPEVVAPVAALVTRSVLVEVVSPKPTRRNASKQVRSALACTSRGAPFHALAASAWHQASQGEQGTARCRASSPAQVQEPMEHEIGWKL